MDMVKVKAHQKVDLTAPPVEQAMVVRNTDEAAKAVLGLHEAIPSAVQTAIVRQLEDAEVACKVLAATALVWSPAQRREEKKARRRLAGRRGRRRRWAQGPAADAARTAAALRIS